MGVTTYSPAAESSSQVLKVSWSELNLEPAHDVSSFRSSSPNAAGNELSRRWTGAGAAIIRCRRAARHFWSPRRCGVRIHRRWPVRRSHRASPRPYSTAAWERAKPVSVSAVYSGSEESAGVEEATERSNDASSSGSARTAARLVDES